MVDEAAVAEEEGQLAAAAAAVLGSEAEARVPREADGGGARGETVEALRAAHATELARLRATHAMELEGARRGAQGRGSRGVGEGVGEGAVEG